MNGIKVLLLSDRPIQREGLCLLLEKAPDITVVGETGEVTEALALIEEAAPYVVLIDMAVFSLEITRQLKEAFPGVTILTMSGEETEPYLFDILAAGASGCVSGTSGSEELISAIREVCSGNMHLSASAARTLVEHYLRRVDKDEEKSIHNGLTRREWETLTYIAAGKHNRDIAELLGVSIRTVQSHRTSLMEKLGVHDSIQLVRYAIRRGLVKP